MTWFCADSLGSTAISARISGNASVANEEKELCISCWNLGIVLIQVGALVYEISSTNIETVGNSNGFIVYLS